MPTPCPLCNTSPPHPVTPGADQRKYYRCTHCSLIFVDPGYFLSPEAEKRHYSTHENYLHNEGYVRFLNQILEPMLPFVDSNMQGLDYGCGPGPTLSLLLQQQGISCDNYDPFFTQAPINPPYDFILATECFEHFFFPAKEMQKICAWLKPGGLLGVMTERQTTPEQFKTWYYTKDPTHIVFYHTDTFDYLCRHYGLVRLWDDTKRVSIFRRLP